MSETASFVDPVFLARFGLSRVNVLDYFLLPLNPFRTKANTSNEVLAMQGISIGMLMQHGTIIGGSAGAGGGGGPVMSPMQAEEEYGKALSKLTGEQYELLPPPPTADPATVASSPLFTIRHILRSSPTLIKILGIYYVVEGIIYKSPAVRSLMKYNVAKVATDALSGACGALAVCARYHPVTGYTWVFEQQQQQQQQQKDEASKGEDDTDNEDDPVSLIQLSKRRKRRKILDNRRPGERTAAEEEGIRASEAIDQILVRLSKSLSNKPSAFAGS